MPNENAANSRIESVEIRGGGLSAKILNYGATLADLIVETSGGPRSVVLGFDDPEAYRTHGAFFGAVAGRCANRIADGRFELDGEEHQLHLNEKGRTHLHGGGAGFWQKLWTIAERDKSSVLLTLVSPDGDQGYPGNLRVSCRYSIQAGKLVIGLTARTDKPTLVNLATHSYFNLDGSDTILDHMLTIPAHAYTPVNADIIPTGELAPVEGTAFDFRTARPVEKARSETARVDYDHNFALAMRPFAQPHLAARLEASRLAMEIWSTEPGLQFYDGNFLPVSEPLRGGRKGQRFGGLCLEPQRFPDAIHHPEFPGSVLRPDETYAQTTEYRFLEI
ncbi:aldose epimerase family protein [Mesorhizobium sp. SB112]|uniref:aldose epimerase family protein n=1 Tax=Mesorhizobium sp. SB112 TaxID=3151853 RepID=UPI0032639BDA